MHAKQGLGSDVQEVAGELSRSSASRGLKSRRGQQGGQPWSRRTLHGDGADRAEEKNTKRA